MAVLNTVTFVGTVTKIYDLRTAGKDGNSVVDFTVAVTRRRRTGDEWEDAPTNWNSVTAWGRLAENIKKGWNVGDRVFVYGEVEMKDGYTNKSGEEVPPKEIVVAKFAGHENSYHDSTLNRPAKRSDGGSESDNEERRAAPVAKTETRRAEPKKAAEPAAAADDLDLGEDFPW